MTAKGHTTLGITVGLAVQQIFFKEMNNNPLLLSVYYFAIVNASLLPDLDEPGSRIGRRFPFFSRLLSLFTTHRGITHFLIVPLAMAATLFFIENEYLFYGVFALALGTLAHDLGDMLTKGGIVGFFYPLFPKKRIGIPRKYAFYTNSIEEYGVIAFLLFINIALIAVTVGDKLKSFIGTL